MRLTIGAGAIGGTIGAHLIRDGHDVLLCDAPLPIAETLEDPRWRPLMLAIAREVLAQAPVPPEGFDGFEPADLEGSLDRLATFNQGSAKSHSGVYRDLVVRNRKTEVDGQLGGLRGPLTGQVVELIHSIERGERPVDVANLELLADHERSLRDS